MPTFTAILVSSSWIFVPPGKRLVWHHTTMAVHLAAGPDLEPGGSSQQPLPAGDHIVHRKAEMFEDRAGRGRFAEGVDAQDVALVADQPAPPVRDAGLHRQALA